MKITFFFSESINISSNSYNKKKTFKIEKKIVKLSTATHTNYARLNIHYIPSFDVV